MVAMRTKRQPDEDQPQPRALIPASEVKKEPQPEPPKPEAPD